jgi:hypothetical protein
MTPLATTTLEHDLATEKLGRDRRNPAEKLFGVTSIVLREMLPLPTEVRSRRALVIGNVSEVSESRNSSPHRIRSSASATAQNAFHYFLLLGFLNGKIQRPVTRRTDEIRE